MNPEATGRARVIAQIRERWLTVGFEDEPLNVVRQAKRDIRALFAEIDRLASPASGASRGDAKEAAEP